METLLTLLGEITHNLEIRQKDDCGFFRYHTGALTDLIRLFHVLGQSFLTGTPLRFGAGQSFLEGVRGGREGLPSIVEYLAASLDSTY